MKRTLTLHGETLTELGTDELAGVVGGDITQWCGTFHIPCTTIVVLGTVMHC